MVYNGIREEAKVKKTICPKCKGKGCAHCGGTGYHKSKMIHDEHHEADLHQIIIILEGVAD